MRTEDDRLKPAILRITSLDVAMGGTSGKEVTLAPVLLRDAATGAPNERHVATYTALTARLTNVADVNATEGIDFVDAYTFDIFVLDPGHDAWVIGDEPCVLVDFGANLIQHAKSD